MKIRASSALKRIYSVVVAMVKAKSMAVRSKTSALKTRLLVLGLLHNKKVLMKAINHKIHALMGQERGDGGAHSAEEQNKAIVLYDAAKNEALPSPTSAEPSYCDDDDNYPDLRHSLFDMEDEDDEENSREDGSEFSLEDEIDHVADVFIRRFHRQMRLQKLESFKRYQEMLQRSV
ncbi:hypothetical protein MUK42_24727 [Musa troglodytarum]|uniref:Uncharacterized protein n=1 Tax=Musa troglodytarum TaxID=320322 RepID=A0A9E7GEW4_9LILI|nr:hypothetical protein MUK42_24727 [Musa troglodytarum]